MFCELDHCFKITASVKSVLRLS